MPWSIPTRGRLCLLNLPVIRPHTAITVTDTGPGLPESEISQMFQPFFRGVEARSRRCDGHGLGLAIAARAIDLHKGTIRERNTGSGLAVSIDLPLSETS